MDVYIVYITTNKTKSVLYTGSSPVLPQRITEHYLNRGHWETFAGRYHAYNVVYMEVVYGIYHGRKREYQIKGWTRAKKIALINAYNPEWKFLNDEIVDEWPPKEGYVRKFR
jgi:putative endonuclease